MELRDLIVTPLVILGVYFLALIIRPYVSDRTIRGYFIPALSLKILGAILLGVIYQFYYTGGDTFHYHTNGSRIIWQAFLDDFFIGLKLLFSNGEIVHNGYQYIGKIPTYGDPPSFVVVRFATIFDLLTYSTYSATAVLFAVMSFLGSWAMFVTFYRKYPKLHFPIALATLFIPSTIFWGSGILKDTIVLAALGFSVYCIDDIFNRHRIKFLTITVLVLSLLTIFTVRKFMLEAFIPSAILWIYSNKLFGIKSTALKIVIVPLLVLLFLLTAYYSVIKVGEGDSNYSIEKLAKTAQVTAYDIRYGTGREAGSGYSLGELDGSFSSMFRLAPQAINVALFRPYVWEVKNPLMLFSALEGFCFLMVTLYILMKTRLSLFKSFSDPNILFCFVFSISVAFAVGVSTFNFGTLVRYKIPLLPFYLLSVILMANRIKETH